MSLKEPVPKLCSCLLLTFQVGAAEVVAKSLSCHLPGALQRKGSAPGPAEGGPAAPAVTYFRSSRSISALSPEMRRCSSGAENIRIHSGLMMDLKPLMRAAVWLLIWVCIRKWAIRWM